MLRQTRLAISIAALAGLAWTQAADRSVSQKGQERIAREVRHELVTLPYYSVFDNLAYRVDGYTVTLSGQTVRPTLKTDAERSVKKIEGVEKVINDIEVLPLSPNDDRIRRAVYRAIYSQPGLEMYSLRAVPTIHIIVRNGNVTLEGAVGNQADKDRAGITANGVSGVFKVANNLLVSP
jgi:hyperosmotically inducible protein